jgi:membrane fusion protein, heavy metal efflux system
MRTLKRWRQAALGLAVASFALTPLAAFAQEEEAGHMHGPDGRHIAVANTFGQSTGKSILSHHDLMIADTRNPGPKGEGTVVLGCDVHSAVYPKGDRSKSVHKEHNTFEPENGVYGSHMMYKTPGEYVIVENVTMPDKTKYTLEFPVFVPDPNPQHEDHGPSPWTKVLWGVGAILLVGGAFLLGKRSGRPTARAASALFTVCLLWPLANAFAQEEETGHMHGPDGRHIAVASTFGKTQIPLKAYPTADLKDAAVQTKDHYRFRLSIENEEMAPPDPDVVPLSADAGKAIGLTTVEARSEPLAGALITTGQVRPNPNRAVTVNARVAGRVVSVGVTPGDQIPAGRVVAVIDSAEIAEAQATLQRGRADLLQAEAGHSRARSQVAEAQAELSKSQADAELARGKAVNLRKALERQKQLASAGAFSQGPVEAARSAVAEAEGELKQAQTAQANLEAQARRMDQGVGEGLVARKDLEAAQSAVSQGRTRVATAGRQLEIAQAALSREERIQREGLRNAREVQQAEAEYEAGQLAARSAEAVVKSQARALEAARSRAREDETAIARAQATIRAALNSLHVLGASPGGGSRITLTAPIGGEVESRPVNAGQSVAAGEVLATVLNTDSVWVESDVFEKDLPRVRVGQRVTITADAVPGRTFTGTVNYVGAEVHAQTRAVRVRTVVSNSSEVLKPNMFVRAAIGATGAGSGMTVPLEALQEDGGQQVVFVELEPGSYKRTAVRVGNTIGDKAILEDGVKPGQKVVTRGAYQLLALVKKG